MNPIEWLNDRAPYFNSLSDEERTAILHFSLLWSFFEAKALDTNASARRILVLSRKLAGEGALKREAFASTLAYFRVRYVNAGKTTEYFDGLRFRRNDLKPLVLSVLKGEKGDLGDTVGALLIIVFRLRNNLFHGVKWEYGIHGEFNNFTNANEVLMVVLDANGKSLTDQ